MHSPAWDACFQLLQRDRQPGVDGRRGIGYELLQRGQADAYKAHATSPVGDAHILKAAKVQTWQSKSPDLTTHWCPCARNPGV
jgi:hypothetical protein